MKSGSIWHPERDERRKTRDTDDDGRDLRLETRDESETLDDKTLDATGLTRHGLKSLTFLAGHKKQSILPEACREWLRTVEKDGSLNQRDLNIGSDLAVTLARG